MVKVITTRQGGDRSSGPFRRPSSSATSTMEPETVLGISNYPMKVIRKDSVKKTAKQSRVKAFIRAVNYSHLMPTRYTLDVDLKDAVSFDALQSRDKKVTAAKEIKKRLEERFKTGKNRWFFSKLRF